MEVFCISNSNQCIALQNQPEVMARLNAAAGLAHLHQKRFKQAAVKFTEVRAAYLLTGIDLSETLRFPIEHDIR